VSPICRSFILVLSLLLLLSAPCLATNYTMSEETRSELINYIKMQKSELLTVKEQLQNSEISLKEADRKLEIVEKKLIEAEKQLTTVSEELTEVSQLMKESKDLLKAAQRQIRIWKLGTISGWVLLLIAL
jgi:septal ring factor EnvC (AmiA/AmiB activator)